MRLVEIYINGRTVGRDLVDGVEFHSITADGYSRVQCKDMHRDVPLAALAQVFIEGNEVWRSANAAVSEAIDQGRVITKVASDEVRVRDQAG